MEKQIGKVYDRVRGIWTDTDRELYRKAEMYLGIASALGPGRRSFRRFQEIGQAYHNRAVDYSNLLAWKDSHRVPKLAEATP